MNASLPAETPQWASAALQQVPGHVLESKHKEEFMQTLQQALAQAQAQAQAQAVAAGAQNPTRMTIQAVRGLFQASKAAA